MVSSEHEKKLFLLDAYALIFRAYYAFIKNPRINSQGLNTSAIFGFTNSLWEVLKNEQPSHIAVVFDPPGGSFRSEDFVEYKANRDATPDDIILAVPWIKKIIEAFNIPVLMVENFEADDTIGTLAKKAEEAGFVTYMMTPDKDFGQLVTEKSFMFRPARGGGPAEVWGPKEICEKFDLESPDQVIDYLGLMGDSADNIPGIPGVGPKTASKLLRQYGSMEGIFENSHELKGKQKENIENFAEQGRMSRKLATIVLDVPIEFNEKALTKEEINEEALKELFKELEFRNLGKRIFGEEIAIEKKKTGGSTQTDMFAAFDAAPEKPASSYKTIQDVKSDYQLVDDQDKIEKLVQLLDTSDCYAFDTETTGLDPITADIVGMSFSVKKGEAFYVPTPKGLEKERIQKFSKIFENPNKVLVAQNMKYDLKVLKRYGQNVKAKIYDTMVAHYLINADSKHGMDFLAETYLNYKPISITELIGKKGKDQKSMDQLEAKEIVDYAAEDADITLQLKELFEKETEQAHLKELYEEIEVPLISVLADMEMEGVSINEETLTNFSSELAKDLEALESKIKALADEDFNVDSPKQLGPILFEKLAISAKAKKTKTGQYSTSEDVLRNYINDHEIIKEILEYRQLKKLKSTYVDPLPTMVNQKTGRIHTNYRQTVAATGRLSSDNPNLQNIPIRTEKGRLIRKAFIPRDENHVLFSADYSQVELRIIAALSQDETMIKAFNSGEDIHAATASKVFGVPLSDVTREMRGKAKAVNFGIIYGQGAFGLAQNLDISRKEAKGIIDSYFEQFSALKKFQQETIEFARKNGYVETIMGRRRYLKDISSSNAVVKNFAERNAINAPIQGSAADIIKIAMISIDEELKKGNYKSKMVMQVHDELVFDAHKDELESLEKLVIDKMEGAYSFDVPLKVDSGVGGDWLEAH